MRTGCNDYAVRDRPVFSSFKSWSEGTTVENPSGPLSWIEGKGSVGVEIRDCHDAAKRYTFHKVLLLPTNSVNLMSVCSAVARSSSFNFAADALHLLAPDGRKLPVRQRG